MVIDIGGWYTVGSAPYVDARGGEVKVFSVGEVLIAKYAFPNGDVLCQGLESKGLGRIAASSLTRITPKEGPRIAPEK